MADWGMNAVQNDVDARGTGRVVSVAWSRECLRPAVIIGRLAGAILLVEKPGGGERDGGGGDGARELRGVGRGFVPFHQNLLLLLCILS